MRKTLTHFEIFCGTGGVGKSTLSASRALFLAQQNKKVLLITIDPAKRLREILGLKLKESGEVKKVELNSFDKDFEGSIDVLLMHPHATFKRLAKDDADNRLLKILTKPHGGTNEIMAVLELNYHFKNAKHDVIILDTAPGKHFIDFLEATEKIKTFFDQSFIEIFMNLEKKVPSSKSWGFLSNLMGQGVKKILDSFSQVTGSSFVEEFVAAINILYKNKEFFIEALELEERLKKDKFCHWYLVACAEQDKIREALELEQSAKNFLHHQNTLILNKTLKSHLESWSPEDENLKKIKRTIHLKEEALLKVVRGQFSSILEFPQTIEDSVKKQVVSLSKNWEK